MTTCPINDVKITIGGIEISGRVDDNPIVVERAQPVTLAPNPDSIPLGTICVVDGTDPSCCGYLVRRTTRGDGSASVALLIRGQEWWFMESAVRPFFGPVEPASPDVALDRPHVENFTESMPESELHSSESGLMCARAETEGDRCLRFFERSQHDAPGAVQVTRPPEPQPKQDEVAETLKALQALTPPGMGEWRHEPSEHGPAFTLRTTTQIFIRAVYVSDGWWRCWLGEPWKPRLITKALSAEAAFRILREGLRTDARALEGWR